MLLDINKIRVSDRIRKDFGNIEELANDIKENGLINSPVVTPEYELIAGERRLRACKHLGMNAITVNVMTVRDYEHQLKLEISENENRKEFTFSERVEWAKRLEKVESLKAKQRMGQGSQNSDTLRTDDLVANESGFGSRDTYRKAKFIADNADEEAIARLDARESSINREYEELKRAKQEAEQRAKRAEEDLKKLNAQAADIYQQNKDLKKNLAEEVEKGIREQLAPAKESLRSEIEKELQKKFKDNIELLESTNEKLSKDADKLREYEQSKVWESAGARNEITRIMNRVYGDANKAFAEIETTFLEKLSPDINTAPVLEHIAKQFIEMGERIQSWLLPQYRNELVIEGDYVDV